ncbi:MAG: type II and III secretion system protein, partial [Candidatus Eisenbacteria bacterium]|nr:type II and III secretion system protein [Candidatus Eisenbacteria bacterium]
MTDFGVDWAAVNYDNPRSYVNLKTAPEPEKFGEIRFGIIRNRYDLDAILRVIQETSNAHILSSPRVVTLNHKGAEIVVGQEIPYVTVTTDEDGNRQVTTEFRKVGTILRTTPHVTHDGNVVLNLRPEQSFVTDWVQNVPVIDTRSATTEMLLGSGQTAVIGGLRKSDEVIAESRVPILGSIPILGNLFRSKRTSRTDVELMVLVTPYILQGDEIVVQDQTPLTSDQARAAYGKLQATYDDMKTQDGMAPVETGAGAEVTQ